MSDVMFPEPMDPMDRAMQRMDKKAWAEADAEIAMLKTRLAEAERDAARYRWLRDPSNHVFVTRHVGGATIPRYVGATLDLLMEQVTADSASAVQPERCCLDYPRCDCNSPPEPDNEWHCSQYPGLEDDIKKYRDAALAGAAVQPIAVTGNCGLCGQPRADHAEVAPDGKPECRMKENSHHG